MTRDPVEAIEDALVLLRTGRPSMALTCLEPLPQLIRTALVRADQVVALAGQRSGNSEQRGAIEEAERKLRELWATIHQEGRELDRLKIKVAAAKGELARIERRPARAKPRERLAAALAVGRITAEEVARVLRVEPAAVQEIAAGRVELASSAWDKVLQAIEAVAPHEPPPPRAA